MPGVVVQFRRRRCRRAGLLPGHPQDESEREGRKDGPRHLDRAARRGQMCIFPRDDGGAERRPEDEELRHDDRCDAGGEETGSQHGGNLTRLASTAGDDRPS